MEHPTTIGDYKLLETIGRGAFSTVYRAKHRNSSREVAIKIIQKDSISRDLVEREVLILKSLDHPFAVAFYEFFENENYYYFVMEHVQGESIHEHLKKYGHFPEWLCKHYFCQLISVLDYLHNELRIAHRDLKLDNIMVDRHGNIRLVDFGLGNAYKGSSAVLQTACGSPHFAPPEMMLGQPYTTSADLWSAAVCLYAMAVGRLPFEDTNIQRLIEKVTDEEPNYPDSLSEHLSTLLQMMLKKQQIQRADITKIRINPWFHSYYLSDKMRYDFGVENGWRNPPMGEFVEDKSILYDIQKYQDPVKLVELLKAKTYNSTTALYRIVKREKTTHEMKGMKANAHNLVNISPIPTISAAASAQQDVKNMIMKMKQRNPRSYNESSTPVKRRRRTELGHEANSDFLTLPMNPQNTRAQVAAQILVRKNPAGSARNNPNKNSALVSDE